VRYDAEPVTAVELTAADTLPSPHLPGFAIRIGDLTAW
jgi:hypothetical protein